jgi:hypothetical protein
MTRKALNISMRSMDITLDPTMDGPQELHCTVTFALTAAPLTNLDGVEMRGQAEVGEGAAASARSILTTGSIYQYDHKRIPGIGLANAVAWGPFTYNVLYGANPLTTPAIAVPVTIELRSLVNSADDPANNHARMNFRSVRYDFS